MMFANVYPTNASERCKEITQSLHLWVRRNAEEKLPSPRFVCGDSRGSETKCRVNWWKGAMGVFFPARGCFVCRKQIDSWIHGTWNQGGPHTAELLVWRLAWRLAWTVAWTLAWTVAWMDTRFMGGIEARSVGWRGAGNVGWWR